MHLKKCGVSDDISFLFSSEHKEAAEGQIMLM